MKTKNVSYLLEELLGCPWLMIIENPVQYSLKSKDISSNEKPRGRVAAELVNEEAQQVNRKTSLFQNFCSAILGVLALPSG